MKLSYFSAAPLLIFLLVSPLVFPAFAVLSTIVDAEVRDVTNDGYPDMVFRATDALGNPVEGVEINVRSVYMTEPFFIGKTNSSGILLFKNVPAGNYTWVSSSGYSGVLEVEPIEFNFPDEVAFLMLFLITIWCGNTTEKGKSFLKGLADLVGYRVALPEIDSTLNNFERANLLYSWLSGLEDYVLAQRQRRPGVFTDAEMGLIYASKDVIEALGEVSQFILTPPSLIYATDGYIFNYLIDRGGALPLNHIFAIRNGFQGLAIMVIALYDLFIFQGTDVIVRVIATDEASWEEKISIYSDFAAICIGFTRLAATIGRAVFKAGAAITNKLLLIGNAFGGIMCFLSAISILLDLSNRYGGNWNRFLEELATPYVIVSMIEFSASVALGMLILANLAGLIPAGSALALGGPIFWAILALAVITCVIKAIWDWITEYWAYVDRIREQISVTMDQIIPVRQLLYSYNLTKMSAEANLFLRIAEVSDVFAQETFGKLRETLGWASEYFAGLCEAQKNFVEAIKQARPVVDKFIRTHLYYDSEDGRKRIRAHLEGINCTNAQYLNPGEPDFFYFKACVYHSSQNNPNIFVFDNHTITYDNLDGTHSETSYTKISKFDPLDIFHPQKGWAWAPPIEHDAQGRTFAVTYTIDSLHHPSGTPTGYNFYFDPAGQWYAHPWNPFRFDPDEHYRAKSKLTPDPNTGSPSFFYHYKFFFDPETTGEFLDLGRPDALDEWMQNLTSQLPILKTKLDTFTSALDKLRIAFSRKSYILPEPIEKGLAWLRSRQYADGSWRSNVGITSLAVLAFLNAGYDEKDPTVRKALNYILRNVRSDGAIYESSSLATYETSLALLPLIATRNSTYNNIVENAKNWLIRCQWDEEEGISKSDWRYGGFGYYIGSRPDLSNTQFATLALDAAGLPKDHPLWTKLQVFLHRCQNVNFSITLNIDGESYTVHPYNHYGGYDGGFIYQPGSSLAGGQKSYGSMTGAGIWGLLLSGVPKTDPRVVAAINWVRNYYTWDGNPGMPKPTSGQYYYYLAMSKALTMYGEPIIDGRDWYREMYDKIVSLQKPDGYWINPDSWAWENIPELVTAYSILSLQTRTIAPPIQRLSYLTFILRSNCLLRIVDPEGNAVGYNYQTGLGENNIPTAIYSGPFMEPQYIVIVNPQAGTYRLELIGISEGPYELTIQGNYGEEVTDTFTYQGEIKPGELHGTDVTVTAIVGPIDVYANPPQFQEIIDKIPPSITIEEPPVGSTLQGEVTFVINAVDVGSGVSSVSLSIREANGKEKPIGFEDLPATYDATIDKWTLTFNTLQLPNGNYLVIVKAADNVGNTASITASYTIKNWTPATVNIEPDTLNLKSKGKWITAYIELQEGYNISDINISTILLNGTIPVDLNAPTAIGDYDNDGVPDLMVKFNRTAVCEFILFKGIKVGNVTLKISGKLVNGIEFEGCGTIRVRMPGDINMDGKVDMKDVSIICRAFGSYPGHSRWNPTADENEDNKIDIFDIALTCRNYGKTYK